MHTRTYPCIPVHTSITFFDLILIDIFLQIFATFSPICALLVNLHMASYTVYSYMHLVNLLTLR